MTVQAAGPGNDGLLTLKIAPPRPRRGWLQRGRLVARFAALADAPLLLVQAPAGFGKTSLLVEFRRECLAQGSFAAWLTLDARDEPPRLVEALLLSLQTALGGRLSVQELQRELSAGSDPLEALGRLLAALAALAHPVVLLLDDAHALPEASARDVLAYLALNLPANLRLLIGSRRELPFPADELALRGELRSLTQAELKFRPEESGELLRARFGGKLDVDAVARLHAAVDGWPLGLQMALTIVDAEDDPAPALAHLLQAGGALQDRVAEAMLPRLPAATLDFLTMMAPLERLHPELCAAVSGDAGASELLAALHRESPVLHASEVGDWYRLHAVCRHALQPRFAALPTERQQELRWRAAQWLHQRGWLDEAAEHALAAGRSAAAYTWVAEGVHTMVLHGRMAQASGWIDRLDNEQIEALPALCLAAALACALSYRHAEAARFVAVLERMALPAAQQYEVMQIKGALAHYRDDVDTCARLIAELGDIPGDAAPEMHAAHVDMRTAFALNQGKVAAARFELRRRQPVGADGVADYGQCYSQFFLAYADYLDGRIRAAESQLAPFRPRAESLHGRRSPLACLLAVTHAAILWDQDRGDEAEAALADRLDVIERACSPIPICLAYRTLIRAALARAAYARALDLASALGELGERRHLPRLVVTALIEQLRIELARGQRDAAGRTLARLQQARRQWTEQDERGLTRSFDVAIGLAEARLALVVQDSATAAAALDCAATAMGTAWPQRERSEADLLARVLAGQQARGKDANLVADLQALAAPAVDDGWARMLADGWPEATGQAVQTTIARQPSQAPSRIASPAIAAAAPSQLLTSKEHEVLGLLARNLTNKEIARALDVGAETVKWHLKNLAGKLHAGGRRHTVERARLLGLLVDS